MCLFDYRNTGRIWEIFFKGEGLNLILNGEVGHGEGEGGCGVGRGYCFRVVVINFRVAQFNS